MLTYSDFGVGDAEPKEVVGFPYAARPHILYLKLRSGNVVGIPKALVVNIEGYTPVEKSSPPEKEPLLPDAPEFQAFAAGIQYARRVRIEYLQELRPDPAVTDEKLNKRGLPTTTEGYASALDETWLTLVHGPHDEVDGVQNGTLGTLHTAIPRQWILSITFLGPHLVAVNTPDAGGDPPSGQAA